MRVGVFGGTFDPPHAGHLIAAQEALEQLPLDRVLFVPAAQPPHKQDRTITPAALRLVMLSAAVAGDPRFLIDDLELHRSGPSYTVDTLRVLRDRYDGGELFLLLGADQVLELSTWRESDEVARLARITLLSREGVESAGTDGLAGGIVRVPRIDISATEIRRRTAAGQSIRYLVPAAVEAIICTEGLYRPASETALAGRGTNQHQAH